MFVFLVLSALAFILFILNRNRVSAVNYRKKTVFIIGLPVTFIISLIFQFSDVSFLRSLGSIMLAVGIIGFIDDIYGSAEKGIKGHLKALFKGKLTTGMIKLTGIAFLALITSYIISINFFDLLVNWVMIAGFSNLYNLLDLRPGRTVKFAFPFFILILYFLRDPLISASFLIYLLYLYPELKEFSMLGDAGSNSLGFLIGSLTALAVKIFWIRFLLMLFVVLLNLLSEKVSFTEIIEKNRFLRWYDSFGRMV